MNKLGFLTKYSLGKKIKSKWFIVVNIIILLVISALINMDSIIKLFGGDFNNNEEILIIDNIGVIDTFKNVYEINNKYLKSEINYSIEEYKKLTEGNLETLNENNKKFLMHRETIEEKIKSYISSMDYVGQRFI